MRTYSVTVRCWRPFEFGGFSRFTRENVEYPAVEAEDGIEACERAELLAQLDYPESQDFMAFRCIINPKEP